ncbi:ABC transporter ATP-binding protein [Candidatus Poribacteria bacterium]|nr:ABC transporter ATP-binding protein [Candidatus Poribacteria bacterium]
MFGSGGSSSQLHEYSEEEDDLGKVYDRELMKRLIAYLKPYRREVVLIVFLMVGYSTSEALLPYLTQIGIDNYIEPRNLQGLETIVLYYVLVLVARFIFTYFEEYGMQMVGQKAMYDMRMSLFSHLQRLDVRFFDNNPVGRLMTRVMGDVEVLKELFTSGVITVFGNLLSIFGYMIAMLLLNWKLALVTFAVLPIIFVTTSVYQVYSRRAFRDQRRYLARINAFLNENIVGMTTMQLFAREPRSWLQFDDRNKQYLGANLRSIFYFSLFSPMIEVCGSLALAVIIWHGGGQILQDTLTFGVLFAFLQYSQRLFWPIRELSEKYTIFQNAMASSERIFDLMDTQPTIVNPMPAKELGALNGEIEFRNVWFAYNAEDYVLRDVSFNVKAGEKVALVGHTGSGKTSIINLLCRFYDVNKGQVLIDGTDLREMELPDLRRAINIVQQNIFLFSGTIEKNINLDNPEISKADTIAAAKEVHLDSYVQRMPEGYETEVREGGAGLSVGQKQLVAFARALASDPNILILDEATSSVDTETELIIQDALNRLMANRTSIVIAHRLSTIQNADKIIVMHRGEIQEMGTHNELLQKRGIYYRLYQLQYKGQEVG